MRDQIHSRNQIAFFTGLSVMLLPWFLVYCCGIYWSSLFLPLAWFQGLVGYKPWLTGPIGAWLLGHFVYCASLFGAAYLVSWFWLGSSRNFKSSIGGLAAASLLTALWFSSYSNRNDWASRGLNPDRPGFKPEVLILAGTVTHGLAQENDYPSAGPDGFFEIRMRGFDCYYRKEWSGTYWQPGSSFNIELVEKDFSGHWGSKVDRGGVKGGGGSSRWTNDFVIARRLWSGEALTRTNVDTLQFDSETDQRSEIFSHWVWAGGFSIPTKIKITSRRGRVDTYRVKRIEFSNRPSEEWFSLIRKKYFDRDRNLLAMDLEEPGVGPGKHK